MENKETINENSFLEQVKAFAQSISDDITKYQCDENKHRALVVLASDAEDDEYVKSYIKTYGNTKDILILLNKLISFSSLPHQKMILDILKKCYKQRKNGK